MYSMKEEFHVLNNLKFVVFNSLRNDKILELTKLKALADDK